MRRHDDNIGRRIPNFQHDTRLFHFPRRCCEISHVNRWGRRRWRQHCFPIAPITVFAIIDYGARRRRVDGTRNTVAAWISSARQMGQMVGLHCCVHWIWQRCRCIGRCIVAECWEFICIRWWLRTWWPRWRRGRRIFTANSTSIEWITGNDNNYLMQFCMHVSFYYFGTSGGRWQ